MMKFLQKYKTYITNLSVYFGASLIPMIVSVVTNPVFAYFLSPEDYAIIGYYTSFNTLLSPFILFYMLHYYQKMYFACSGEQKEQLKALIFQSLFYFSLVLLLISLLGIFIYTNFISPNKDLPYFPYGILALIPCWFANFYIFFCTDLKMQRNSKMYFRMNMLNMFFTVGTSLLLVAVIKLGATGKLLGNLVGTIVMFFIVFTKGKKYLHQKFNKAQFKEMFVFCAPLVIAAMLGFFSNGFDRVYLERVASVETLGYYSVGFSIAAYLTVFSKAIGDTFGPDIFQFITEKQYIKCLKIILVQIGLVSLIIGAFVLLAPYIVFILTAGRYVDSVPYVKILALSSVTSCIYYAFSQVIVASGFTKITLLNKIIGSVLCIVLYSTFITKWGAIGAAWSVVLSHLIFAFGALIIMLIYKFKKIKYVFYR